MNNSLFLLIIAYFAYYFLCSKLSNVSKFIFIIIFAFASVILRLDLLPSETKDYYAYYNSMNRIQNTQSDIFTLIEPYKNILFIIASYISFGSLDTAMFLVYFFHLSICVIFFLWISGLHDVNRELKMIFFSMYFLQISYVWLRAGPAYILFGYFIYHGYRERNKLLGYLVPLIHISSMPVMIMWIIRKSRIHYQIVAFLSLTVVIYFGTNSNLFNYIMLKIIRYAEISDRADNIKHMAFLLLTFFIFIYHLRYSIKIRTEIYIYLIFFLYVSTHFFNVVVSQRISVYFIISMLFISDLNLRFFKLFPLVIPLFLFLFVYRFMQLSV